MPRSRYRDDVEQWKSRGAAVLYLLEGDKVLGAFALEDEVREESREAVEAAACLGSRSR